ncbi:MAG: helix-turn-helix transcriptional regulator [Bacteroidales bacterium]|nr:helix-turn-helix transcriptional regulator [Bacteroidales bacterium]
MQLDAIHTRIRHAREQAGFSQTEMAEELGVGRTSYVAFESGHVRLFHQLVGRMADRLGLTPEELLFGTRPDEGLLRDQAALDEWKRATVTEYEQRLAALQEKLDAKNQIIETQQMTIRSLNESNQYLISQLRKNE